MPAYTQATNNKNAEASTMWHPASHPDGQPVLRPARTLIYQEGQP